MRILSIVFLILWMSGLILPLPTVTSLPTQTVTPLPTSLPTETATTAASPTLTPWPTATPQNPANISKIAFDRCHDNECDIYLISPDGTGLVNLTAGSDPYSIESEPHWAPDGQRVYFFLSQGEGFVALYSINPDGTDSQYLFDMPRNLFGYSYDISPDGEWLVYTGRLGKNNFALPACAVYKMRVDGSAVTQLTALNHSPETPYQFCDFGATWSPDGQQILFISDRDDAGGQDYRDVDLYIMNSDGQQVTRLTDRIWSTHRATWSPDGQQVALVVNDGFDAPSDLYLLNVASGGLRQISQENPNRTQSWADYLPLSWSPDSQQLVGELGRASKAAIGLVDITTGVETLPLTEEISQAKNPDWSPWLPAEMNYLPTPIPIESIDTDGDGIADINEGSWDIDGDGLPNKEDLDSDGAAFPMPRKTASANLAVGGAK